MTKNSSRQRMLDAFNYNHPDKIPVVYHPSKGGLYVHGQPLLDLFLKYPSDNPIEFEGIPQLGPEAFDADGRYHEILTDDWGVSTEYRIYGIAGHSKYYPITSWAEAVKSYQFPPIPNIGSEEFLKAKERVAREKEDFLVFDCWISLFEKVCMLHPFDQVLMDLFTKDPDLIRFLDRLVDYWMETVEYHIALGTDVFVFGDDWGTQISTIVSPDLFREIFKPRYQKLMNRVQEAGGLVFVHCCGFMGELMEEFAEMGIRGLWPQLRLFEESPTAQQLCIENKIAVYLHPDRQRLIPMGTPEEIDEYVRVRAEKYKKLGGGGIFYVEIENDAPFENVKALIEAIHKYR